MARSLLVNHGMKKILISIVMISMFYSLPARSESPVPPSSSAGASLYEKHCANCHGKLEKTRIPDRPAARIASAIKTLGIMASLRSLSPAQIEDMARVLRSDPDSSAGN